MMVRSVLRSRPETTLLPRVIDEHWMSPMREIQETMNTLLSQFFGEIPLEVGEARIHPPINLYEKEGDLIVEAVLPGLRKDDMDISCTPHLLTIKGQIKKEKEIREEKFYRCEMPFGSFLRTVQLPHEVKPDKIRAVYKDGILELTLPLAEEARAKSFKVTVE
ncbi:MAG: Hsp20/alpha crystallin family protein [Armatimonadetes bacterium]|nr:Hsp20/alpha crystallin family protein [Armatimonadota bacterium]